MGTTTTTDAFAGRRLLVASLAALAAVTGVSFGRVFRGTHPSLRLAAAAVAAVAVAALLERRHLGLSLLASLAAMIVFLGILVFPGTTWIGIPTQDTVRAVVEALGRAGDRAAMEVAPAAPLPSLMTAAMIAIWSACAASHALAVRVGATVLPLLPGAALLGFVGVVTGEPPRPGYVVAFLGAAFMLLFAQAVARGWRMGRGRRALASTRWARWMGAVAIVAALALPGVLPGYRAEAILEFGKGGGRVSISPIVDIRPNLLRNPPAELFRVRAGRPSYWRMVTLDRFDGNVWSSPDLQVIDGPPLEGPTELGGSVPASGAHLEQRFTIRELNTTWLPAASKPLAVDLDPELGARLDSDSGILALNEPAEEGTVYDVTSSTPTPRVEDLLRIDPSDFHPQEQMLPPELPFRILEITEQITRRADTPFEKVFAIQQHLRTFRYDERAPAGHGSNAMVNFLDETRQGYCEQFAGTMAVMVRALGLPSRVAVGFLPGDRDRTGSFRVTTNQVHAWPEVYFEEHGWLAFEPTPSRNNPAARYLSALTTEGGRLRDRSDGAGGGLGNVREDFRPQDEELPAARTETPELGAEDRQGPTWRLAVLLAACAAAVATGVLGAIKALRRRRQLGDRRDPRRRVVAAYGWMAGGAGDLGMGRRRGETLDEYRARLGTESGISGDALDLITGLAGRALYSGAEVLPGQADEAVMAARDVLRSLRREAGPARVVAGALRP